MSDVELDYIVPSDDLAPFVTLFYHFRARLALFDDIERADHAQLRFRLSPGNSHYHFVDGTRQDTTPIHVVGATSGAMRTVCDGPVEVFGMGLTPAGWSAFLGIDASSMVNRALDASALLGPRIVEAARLLAEENHIAPMVRIVEALLRTLAAERGDGATLRFCQQVDEWLAGSASPAIETLCARSGLSRRQVERRCNHLYGCPPKLLARKYRALRAAVAIAAEAASLDELIADGFYDQSHLIREIKQFTGLTPRQMRDEPGVLAQLTISQRRALEGQVRAIISDT